VNLCQHCGVEVEVGARYCPLCRRPLTREAADESPQPLSPAVPATPAFPAPAPAPTAAHRRLRRWLLEVFSLLTVTAAIVVIAADFATGMSITWARYPLSSLAFLWLLTLLLIAGAGRFWVILPGAVAVVGLFLYVLDRIIPGRAWFLPLALPVTLLAAAFLALTIATVRMLKLSPFATVATTLLAGSIFAGGLELLVNGFRAGRWSVSWSVVVFACALPMILILCYLRRRFQERQAEIRKMLHL
jgi:hypothetical protein